MKMLAVKHAVPGKVVTNLDIMAEFTERMEPRVGPDTLAGMTHTLERTLELVGARTRHHRREHDVALDFGLAAARQALDEAGLEPADVQLLLFVGVGRGFIEPATANVFQTELGCSRATCFDILDACASWLRAVDVVQHYLRGGTYANALIINCEFNYREYANWDLQSAGDLETAWSIFTIGEAATATVLAADDGDDFQIRFRNAGGGYHLCHIPLPNFDQFHRVEPGRSYPSLKFYSDAAPLTRQALQMLDEQYRADPLLYGQEHDLILTHSASTRTSLMGLRGIGLDVGLFHDVFPRFGNTVSASLPVGLADAIEQGVLERGQRVLMMMGSAGVAAGVCSFTY
jgi:3-oxoacyl-[acyl-carrier-protein] synthase III